MKRIFAMVAIGVSLLVLLTACGPSSSGGEAPNQGTPSGTIESSDSESNESKFDMGALMSRLIDQGAVVAVGDGVTQPFFSVPGQTIMVDQESVQVFTHPSPAAAQADADLVDPTGSTVGTTSISWMAPPHFYLKDGLLVLYVGGNGPVMDLLETVLGPQFAGA